MQSELRSAGAPEGAVTEDNIGCPNCRALMPRQMRFCRLCGFRLGEGVAEYVATARFDNAATAAHFNKHVTAAEPFRATGEQGTRNTGEQALDPSNHGRLNRWKKVRCRKHPHRIIWLLVGLVMAPVVSGGFLAPFGLNFGNHRTVHNGGNGSPSRPGSFLKTGDFKDANGGAYIESSEPPNSPLDKAGLLGGDIIIGFDGHPLRNASDLKRQLASTPTGKTVEVLFTRDGETKRTTLMTSSEEELEKLSDLADDLPDEGRGFIGEGRSLDRVTVPGSNIYGVRLGSIRRNSPAEISGLRNGDIVIEFNGVPVRTRQEFESRIVRSTPGSTVKVVAVRGNERLVIPVKINNQDD